MRKLRPAEEKYLENFPKDLTEKDDPNKVWLEGIVYPYRHPKGTNIRTIENLVDLKILKIANTTIAHYPITITNKGRYLRKKLKDKKSDQSLNE